MAPTSAEIEQLLTSRPIHEHIKSDNPGILNFGGLENIFADNIHIEIPGLDVDIHGLEQFESDSVHPDIPSLTDVINTDLPVEVSAPHVIGGGDDSHAVIIANSKGTTHSGKQWDHDSVTLLHFNSDDKVDKITLYIDTKHIHEHVNDHRNR